jgi:carbamoyltransferase
MEFGPRALGNRSILADPRSEKMQKNLNLKIKYRESFRPFAPAILVEKLNSWFNAKIKSPYMLLVYEVKDSKLYKKNSKNKNAGLKKLYEKRSIIPAVTHVDNTARVQTVDKNTNLLFYNLINAFYKKTKCPILINTSFNIRSEPIVCTPEDAFKCFMGTEMDLLVIGNYLIYKKEQDKALIKDYRKDFVLD